MKTLLIIDNLSGKFLMFSPVSIGICDFPKVIPILSRK
jgi:hypothetical protein